MSNRRELKKYRDAAKHAQAVQEAVEALPRKIGSLVQWGENGVIWRRHGDDLWVPLPAVFNYVADIETYGLFPSSHVAMSWQGWKQIKQLPTAKETP